MKRKLHTLAAAVLLALAAGSAQAQNTVGYNQTLVPAQADARLSVPFNQAIEGTFAVVAKTSGGVTVSDALVAAKYANAYYVRFTSGNASGLWATISTNTTNEFVLADANVLARVSAGDTFRVYKHHTLGSLFPKGLYGVSFTNGTVVNIFANDLAAMRQNKSAAKSATYTTNGGGRWAGAGVSDTTVLVPETQFILRNNSTQQLKVYTMGAVPDYTVSMLIAPAGDLVFGSGYPVPVVLKTSGLGGDLRTVFFYDNTSAGFNKSSAKAATYTTSGGGRWLGAGVTGNELVLPSQTITLRLPAGETATKVTLPRPY